MKGNTVDGKTREFAIAVSRDVITNELRFDPVRHYTDTESTPAFEGTEPWQPEEMREND